LHRADTVYVNVPPGTVWVVDLRLRKPIAVPDKAPDLAISLRDIVPEAEGFRVTVHNVGNAPSKPTSIVAEAGDGGARRKVGEAYVPAIASPKGFVPKTASVLLNFSPPPKNARLRFVLDPHNRQYEICETNNAVCLRDWSVARE
jgi:hypothetical protein